MSLNICLHASLKIRAIIALVVFIDGSRTASCWLLLIFFLFVQEAAEFSDMVLTNAKIVIVEMAVIVGEFSVPA